VLLYQAVYSCSTLILGKNELEGKFPVYEQKKKEPTVYSEYQEQNARISTTYKL
jgi:hypothetical protein